MAVDPRTGQTQINPLAFALQQPAPRTTPELGVRLLSQALLQRQHNQQQAQQRQQQASRQQALIRALGGPDVGPPSQRQAQLRALVESGDPLFQKAAISEALAQPEQREQFVPVLDDQGRPIAQRSTLTGKIVADPRAPKEPAKPANFVNFANPQTGKIQSAREGSPEAEALVRQGFIRSGTSGGLQFEVGPDGGIRFKQGGTPGQGFGKKATNDLETKMVEGEDRIARLQNIVESFDPQYLELGTRFNTLKTATMEKLGVKPSPSDRKQLADFSKFKRRAMEEVNLSIKTITGAQMSEYEVPRLMAQMPNPGQGLLDGDSPTEFQTKLQDVLKTAQAAQARWADLRERGLVKEGGKITNRLAAQFPLDDYMPEDAGPATQQKEVYDYVPGRGLVPRGQ